MASLTGQAIASSYDQLIALPSGGGNGATLVALTDGNAGTTFGFKISTNALSMDSTNQLQFGDTGTYIYQSADGVLDLVSDTEIELNATTIDINGAVDISGAAIFTSGIQSNGSLTVGVDDTGYDVKFFGATSGCFMMYDQSENELVIERGDAGAGNKTAIKLDTDSTATGDSLSIDWNLSGDDLTTSPSCQIKGIRAGSAARGDLAFLTRNSSSNLLEAMRISEEQFVGIGENNPTFPLHVKDASAGDYIAMFDNSNTSSTSHGIQIQCGDTDHADSDTHYITFKESDGGTVGELDSDSGNLALSDASDERLKKNITNTSTNGLQIINGVRMVDFQWKKSGISQECGIIAQELQKVFPRSVKEGLDSDKTLRIRKTDFIYVLVKAVQELSASNDALKKRIEALEAA